MSKARRIELFNRLIDHGLSEAEQRELDDLQRSTRARIEPPIDVKNEIRMAALEGLGPLGQSQVMPSSTPSESFRKEFMGDAK